MVILQLAAVVEINLAHQVVEPLVEHPDNLVPEGLQPVFRVIKVEITHLPVDGALVAAVVLAVPEVITLEIQVVLVELVLQTQNGFLVPQFALVVVAHLRAAPVDQDVDMVEMEPLVAVVAVEALLDMVVVAVEQGIMVDMVVTVVMVDPELSLYVI